MRNIAIILAGGTGSRMGGGMPKQLLPLADGQTILEHSVAAFEQAECIDEIGIVMHPDYIARAEEMLLRNGWQKVAFIISGGKERRESSMRAIERVNNELRMKNDEGQDNLATHQPINSFNKFNHQSTNQPINQHPAPRRSTTVCQSADNQRCLQGSDAARGSNGSHTCHRYDVHGGRVFQWCSPSGCRCNHGAVGRRIICARYTPSFYADVCADAAGLSVGCDSPSLRIGTARPKLAIDR